MRFRQTVAHQRGPSALLVASLMLATGFLLLAGCTGSPTGVVGQPMDLTVLATGDVQGYVDPCG